MSALPQAPQPAVHVQGQEPLTASMLAAAPPQEQKQMLGKVKLQFLHIAFYYGNPLSFQRYLFN